MNVLIADEYEQSGISALTEFGCEVHYDPVLQHDALAEAVRAFGTEILIVRSTRVTQKILEAGQLRLVVRAGAGHNTIDVTAASELGIYISDCPGKYAAAVAELAFGLMLALDRRIPDNVLALRAGRWNKKEFSKAPGLYRRTLGLLGLGCVGREMVVRAAAFGMPLVIWSRRFAMSFGRHGRPLSKFECREVGLGDGWPEVEVTLAATPAEVAVRADILSLHLALTPDTHGLINGDVLRGLRPGALLINTACAELIDHAALAQVVRDKGVRLGLDVFPNEPSAATGDFTPSIARVPGVYGTHHIGASTAQARATITTETLRIIRTYLQTGRVLNAVNLAKRTPATYMLVVRHRDRPGVLAHVFDLLARGHLNVQETENIVFEGATAAVARIGLDREPPSTLLQAIREGNPNISDLQLITVNGDHGLTQQSGTLTAKPPSDVSL